VEAAREDYDRSDFSAARGKLDGVLSTYPNWIGSAEPYYLRALCRVHLSDKAGALTDAEKAVELSRDETLTTNARAMAGTLAFETGDEAAARAHFAEAIQSLPERAETALVRYRYGLCLQHAGEWKEARAQFAIVVQRHPSGDLAEHARRMVEWPADHFSIQCGAFQQRSGASQLSAKIARSGLPARVESRSRLGKQLHVVLVGQYSNYAEAEAALPSVKRHVPGAVIAP
jgi:tetratricopeptide (TPR) repeat protein